MRTHEQLARVERVPPQAREFTQVHGSGLEFLIAADGGSRTCLGMGYC
jgi:hypothetical protein